ncbi:MAG: DUF2723 domain-containing protein [Bacteroidota bacterium]
MGYKRINDLTGWAVFAAALITYMLTMAPTASYWDCGEFIACANELEAPHPPGAPFFLLVGRLFAMLSFGDAYEVGNIAWMLNLSSALASAFTVLFTFWITTHLAKKIIIKAGEHPNTSQTIAIMAAGAVAGLTNTFADSFWFNAVEAEVYAMSSFFTAIVVWLMFKWEARADEPGNERWIILIIYLMGLSIGVHLLNLLTVPALAYIYYFRKYSFTWPGFFLTGLISVGALGLIQTGIILYTFDFAWGFEKFFVGVKTAAGLDRGGLGMPIGSGMIIFFIVLFGGLIAGIWYSHKTKRLILNISLLCVAVVYVGLASYMMIPIRSGANPPIDENNPENAQTFLSYMKREQYGDRPLLRGPLYNARPVGLKDNGKEYILEEGAETYTELGVKKTYRYSDKDIKFFPRMYERNRYNSGPHGYVNYVRKTGKPNTPDDDQPTNGEDLRFFFRYQVWHMYGRYFMWNFAGKTSDVQDEGWESGFNFSDKNIMPDFIRNQPAKNHYFFIPLILGLLGLGYQTLKRGNDAAIVGMLFFFTGLAIVIYLNQYPMQPRERDYSFAGSFQTFAIWVGLGVIALYELLKRYLGEMSAFIAAAIGFVAPFLMGSQNWDDHSRAGRYVAPDSAYNLLNSCAKNAVLFTNGDNDTFPLWYIQEVEGVRTDVRVLCLSYVNTDWYIDQMKLQMNESPPLPLSLKRSDYVGQAKQSRSLSKPTLNMSLPANGQQLLAKGIISEEELPYVQTPMVWSVPGRGGQNNKYLELKDVLILNLLQEVAKGGWERPVYFANTVSPNAFLGMDDFFRLEGLAYRVLPVKIPKTRDPFDVFPGRVDTDRVFENLVGEFRYRNLDKDNVYYDENVLRMVSNYHNTFTRLSNGLSRESKNLSAEAKLLADSLATGNVAPELVADLEARQRLLQAQADTAKSRAIEVLEFAEEKFPYTIVSPEPYLVARNAILWDDLGMPEKTEEYFNWAKTRALETLKYYQASGKRFNRKQQYAFPLTMVQRYYAQKGMQEELQTLSEEMRSLGLIN